MPLPVWFTKIGSPRGRPRKDGLPPQPNPKAARRARQKRTATLLRTAIVSIEAAQRSLVEALQKMNEE